MNEGKRTLPPGHRWVAAASYRESIGGGESLLRADVIRCEGCGVRSYWCAHDCRYYVDVDEDIFRDVLPSCEEERVRSRAGKEDPRVLVQKAIAVLGDVVLAVGDGAFGDLWDLADDAVHTVVSAAATAVRDGLVPPTLVVDRDGASLVLDGRGLVHVAGGAEIVITEQHETDGPSLGAVLVASHVWFWGEIAAGLVARLKSGAQEAT